MGSALRRRLERVWRRRSGQRPRSAAEVFACFKDVIGANNAAVEIIADLGEKLGGDFIFDRRYIETSVEALVAAVGESVAALHLLTGEDAGIEAAFERLAGRLARVASGRPETGGPLLLPLERVGPGDDDLVGGKAAALAEVARSPSFAVPEGFVVTTAAFHAVAAHHGLADRLARFESLLADPAVGEAPLEECRRSLEEGMAGASPPPALETALETALDRLRGGGEKAPWLAVRSSALEEDAEASFAGQYRSVLQVPAEPGPLFDAWRRVAASLFGLEAVRYRRRLLPGEGRTGMAVLCQRMVNARAAGVLYTVDTTAPASERMVVVGAPGLGAAVVEGGAPADVCYVSKEPEPRPLACHVAAKPTALVPATRGEGVVRSPLAADDAAQSCLDDADLTRLGRTGLRLERFFKRPQDVEWAIDREGNLAVLQSRRLLVTEAAGGTKPLPETLRAYPVAAAGLGRVAQQGIGAGPVFFAGAGASLDDFPAGGVLVARRDSSRFAKVMHTAAAIITEVGTPVSHMATLCREFRVPCLVGADGVRTLLSPGEVVTVDAEDRRIYRGRVRELLVHHAAGAMNVRASAEFRLLGRVLREVSPLQLLDPLLEEFRPGKCRTFHDLLRLIHETAVAALVEVGRDERRLMRDHLVRRLDLPVPAGIMVIDLGGGLVPGAPAGTVSPDDVASTPFRAILRGMLHPGAWHLGSMPVGFRDFMSSMLAPPPGAAGRAYTGHNVAIVGPAYVNLCFRFGYHFNIIDAFCHEAERDNHIYFRFLGGATDLAKRSRRARLIERILEALDFTVTVRGDLVIARAGTLVREEMERILDLLGRLVGFTRQLDVCMEDDALVETYAEAFLAGDYEVAGREE